ncbi:MAG: hypothetical protein AB1641_09885 [Thermodesulfobacteriota bacterium]
MIFKGFDDWIEIFRGGPQVDGRGRTHDGDALIETALTRFNAAEHEPPVVVGHPADNAPAYGWIENLRRSVRDGAQVLEARFKQVVPEFADLVNRGLFKKRSAAFYPDGRLRHVGFLGAAPPAVKGLADIKFGADDGAVSFEYQESGTGILPVESTGQRPVPLHNQTGGTPMFQTFSEFLDGVKALLGFSKEIAAQNPAQPLPPVRPSLPLGEGQGEGKSFSEADVKKLLDQAEAEAEAKARKKVEAEFAEKSRLERLAARKAEVKTWCDRLVTEGKLTPALVKAGLPQVLEFLAGLEDVLEFAEAQVKGTAHDRLKAIFEAELPKLVTFGELAKRSTDPASGGAGAGAKLQALVSKKLAENKSLTYGAAFAEVQAENPELARQYAAEFRQGV